MVTNQLLLKNQIKHNQFIFRKRTVITPLGLPLNSTFTFINPLINFTNVITRSMMTKGTHISENIGLLIITNKSMEFHQEYCFEKQPNLIKCSIHIEQFDLYSKQIENSFLHIPLIYIFLLVETTPSSNYSFYQIDEENISHFFCKLRTCLKGKLIILSASCFGLLMHSKRSIYNFILITVSDYFMNTQSYSILFHIVNKNFVSFSNCLIQFYERKYYIINHHIIYLSYEINHKLVIKTLEPFLCINYSHNFMYSLFLHKNVFSQDQLVEMMYLYYDLEDKVKLLLILRESFTSFSTQKEYKDNYRTPDLITSDLFKTPYKMHYISNLYKNYPYRYIDYSEDIIYKYNIQVRYANKIISYLKQNPIET